MSETSDATAPARIGLELALHPDDAATFWRASPLPSLRAGKRVRPTKLALLWHDSPEATLADAGVALVEQRQRGSKRWRLEQLAPAEAAWPPLLPRPVLAEAATPTQLRPLPNGLLSADSALPASLAPIATFEGVTRALALEGDTGLHTVALQVGTLVALERTSAACRVVLEGSPRETFALARALAGPLRLVMPGGPFPSPWWSAASGGRPDPVILRSATPVGDALATLVANLTQVLLYWTPRVSEADPEPVHQMRVALRRLRAALKLFGAAAAYPELDTAVAELQAFGRLLGAARDWDVFIAGLGASVAAAFPTERAVTRLLREAEAHRRACYADLSRSVAGPQFRCLGIRLAELAISRPWAADTAGDARAEGQALRDYFRHALRKRLRRLREAGACIEAHPDAALHALRLRCKRLRYSAEFAAPLFRARPARRFLRRLAAVQERLGRLNDGVVAAEMMQRLGGGAGRALAAGVVRGFVASRNGQARAKAERVWRRFADTAPFWDE